MKGSVYLSCAHDEQQGDEGGCGGLCSKEAAQSHHEQQRDEALRRVVGVVIAEADGGHHGEGVVERGDVLVPARRAELKVRSHQLIQTTVAGIFVVVLLGEGVKRGGRELTQWFQGPLRRRLPNRMT